MAEEVQNSNNGGKTIRALQNLNWPTLVLILATGGGNLFTTLQNRGQIDSGREQVIRQVGDLHGALDDFEKRQREMLDGIHDSLKNQTIMLSNQRDIMQEIKRNQNP